MSDERRFDDEWVAEILKRAAELQHRGAVPALRGEGLSQSDLERVANEAGIDPEYVRRAIAESGSELEDAGRSKLMGEVKTIEASGLLDGEVGSDAMERMIEEVQRTFADTSDPSYTDTSATWTGSTATASTRLSNLMVAITARNGQTEIRVTERLDNLSAVLFGALGIAGSTVGVAISGAIGMGEFGSPLLFAAGAVTAVGSVYGLARTLFTRSVRRRRRELQRLVSRMVEVSISDRMPAAVPEPGEPQTATDD